MIVGIDIGTQSLKAVVTDARLKVTGEGAIQYRPSYPGPDRVEQNPAIWERALAPAIAAALKQAEVPAGRVAALGICGQLDGCVAVDGSGAPLGPCLIWMDRRAQAEAAEVPSELTTAWCRASRPSSFAHARAWCATPATWGPRSPGCDATIRGQPEPRGFINPFPIWSSGLRALR